MTIRGFGYGGGQEDDKRSLDDKRQWEWGMIRE
jgi:hypothetical protein